MAAESLEPCVLVFGQGRNFEAGDETENRMWDQINLSFNQAATQALSAGGQRAIAMVLKTSATDLEGNQRLLLDEAKQGACKQVLETAVFVDPVAQVLVARLRLYPLLGARGPRLASALPTIGASTYSIQRVFEFTRATLDRFHPEALGGEMVEELLPRLNGGR